MKTFKNKIILPTTSYDDIWDMCWKYQLTNEFRKTFEPTFKKFNKLAMKSTLNTPRVLGKLSYDICDGLKLFIVFKTLGAKDTKRNNSIMYLPIAFFKRANNDGSTSMTTQALLILQPKCDQNYVVATNHMLQRYGQRYLDEQLTIEQLGLRFFTRNSVAVIEDGIANVEDGIIFLEKNENGFFIKTFIRKDMEFENQKKKFNFNKYIYNRYKTKLLGRDIERLN